MVFSESPVFSTNKTDRHDITEILLKVVFNTIKQTNNKLAWSSQNSSFSNIWETMITDYINPAVYLI